MRRRRKKKWGGLKSTAMEMKHRRLIKDSLEEQRGLGSLSSLSHTCWCSSGPIYYRPRLHPTTTTSEIFMSASSVFYVLSARFQIFLLSPSPERNIWVHSGAKRRRFFKNIVVSVSWFCKLTKDEFVLFFYYLSA